MSYQTNSRLSVSFAPAKKKRYRLSPPPPGEMLTPSAEPMRIPRPGECYLQVASGRVRFIRIDEVSACGRVTTSDWRRGRFEPHGRLLPVETIARLWRLAWDYELPEKLLGRVVVRC